MTGKKKADMFAELRGIYTKNVPGKSVSVIHRQRKIQRKDKKNGHSRS